MSDKNNTGPSREKLIEEFGEEYVERTEWWSSQMSLVGEVKQEIIKEIRERPDVQMLSHGSSTNHDGKHEVNFRLRVAGEPLEMEQMND